MFKSIMLAISLIALSGCVTTAKSTAITTAKLEQVSSSIVSLEESLSKQINDSCNQDNQQLISDLKAAIQENKEPAPLPIEKNAPLPLEKKVVYVERCTVKKKQNVASNKIIIGEIENVFLVKEKISFKARVDTGADTSSLGVYNLTRFERDGNKWVKFSLTEKQGSTMFEYPVFSTVRIKQQSFEKAERRIEIKLTIKVGDKEYHNQVFNLADRSHLEFQVLIGRNFLKDIAIVDVSKKHLTGDE